MRASDSDQDYRARSWQSWLLDAGGDLWLADIISAHVNDEYLIKHMLAVNLGIRDSGRIKNLLE